MLTATVIPLGSWIPDMTVINGNRWVSSAVLLIEVVVATGAAVGLCCHCRISTPLKESTYADLGAGDCDALAAFIKRPQVED